MVFFRWGEGQPLPDTSTHELAHHRVCKGLGCSGEWQHDHKNNCSYWASYPGSSDWNATVIECAGYLTGGGDDDNDRRAAIMFSRGQKWTIADAEAKARELMR